MKRNLLSFLFIAITLGIIVVVAFSNSELTNAWNALFTLDVKWMLAAFLGWLSYMFFDTLSLHYFLQAAARHNAWLFLLRDADRVLLLQHHARRQRRAAHAGVLFKQAQRTRAHRHLRHFH